MPRLSPDPLTHDCQMHLPGAKVQRQPLPCSTTFSGFLSPSKKAHCHRPGFWVLNSMTPTLLSTSPPLLPTFYINSPTKRILLFPEHTEYFPASELLPTKDSLPGIPSPPPTLFPKYVHTPQLCRASRSAPHYGNLRCLLVPVPTLVRRLSAPQLKTKSEPSPGFLGHREGQILLKNRSVFSHQPCLLRNNEYLTLMTTTLKNGYENKFYITYNLFTLVLLKVAEEPGAPGTQLSIFVGI